MPSAAYYRAVRARRWTLVVLIAVVVGMGWTLAPIDSLAKFLALAALLAFFGVSAALAMRRQMKPVACGSCRAELYSLVETASAEGKPLVYCPYCGHALQSQVAER